MSVEEDVSSIESQLKAFRIIGLEDADYTSRFEPKQGPLDARLDHIEQHLRDFTIRGGADMDVSGSFNKGFAISCTGGTGAGGGGGGGGPTPTGACCISSSCSVLTSADCATMGGTYQGDGTPCSPNPCGNGACCCPDDPSCFITDRATCIACCPVCTFQGGGTTCDPNPCGGACCTPSGCVDALDETDCVDNHGGNWQGAGVVCDPTPCGLCCPSDFTFEVPCKTSNETDCTNAGNTFDGLGTTCDSNSHDCCVVLHGVLNVCWVSAGCCVIQVNETIDFDITMPCPFDRSVDTNTPPDTFFAGTVGALELFSQTIGPGPDASLCFSDDPTVDCAPGSPPGHNWIDISGAYVIFYSSGITWSNVDGWEISVEIRFPNWPAGFLYGPATPGMTDLRGLGTIDIPTDTSPCPWDGTSDGIFASFSVTFS